jgi:hypothetical protein
MKVEIIQKINQCNVTESWRCLILHDKKCFLFPLAKQLVKANVNDISNKIENVL